MVHYRNKVLGKLGMRKPTVVEKVLTIMIYIVTGVLVFSLVISEMLDITIAGWVFALVIGLLFLGKLIVLSLSTRSNPDKQG